MCGRFTVRLKAGNINEAYLASAQDPDLSCLLKHRYNVAPSHDVSTLVFQGTQTQIKTMQWGYQSDYFKSGQRALINARIETADTKPSFKHAFATQRCVIPASGYYEWKDKQAYYFYPQEPEHAFFFAGLWNTSKQSAQRTCCILTQAAHPSIRFCHHRMPVLLAAHDLDTWLYPQTSKDELKQLLNNQADPTIRYHPVSDRVHSSREDSPELIRKDSEPKAFQTELFN